MKIFWTCVGIAMVSVGGSLATNHLPWNLPLFFLGGYIVAHGAWLPNRS